LHAFSLELKTTGFFTGECQTAGNCSMTVFDETEQKHPGKGSRPVRVQLSTFEMLTFGWMLKNQKPECLDLDSDRQ